MALAEAFLAGHFNRDGFPVVDHRTYALVSDGDLQEGVCMEASALAGLWGLGKLTFLYDSNEIQLDGPTDMVWREDVLQRFQAIGWHVIAVADGNDPQADQRGAGRGATGHRPAHAHLGAHDHRFW